MCKLVNPGCNFAVRAKTEDEVIELARMHQEIAHGVKEISPDLEKKVVKNYTVGIKYVSFICYPTRDSNGEKRAKAQVQ
jgi:predicted small metal-binding protein